MESQSYGASPAIWDHKVLPATQHGWARPAITPARQTGTRFTYPGGMDGWVDLVTQKRSRRESNSRPLGPESNALTTEPPSNRCVKCITCHHQAYDRGCCSVLCHDGQCHDYADTPSQHLHQPITHQLSKKVSMQVSRSFCTYSEVHCVGARPPFWRFEPARVKPN